MIILMLVFPLFLGAGAAFGLVLITWRANERRALTLLDDAIWVLLGSLLVGRAVFVALTWSYFQAHLLEVPGFWAGGMSGPGSLAGGIITVLILIRIRKEKGSLFDDLLPLAGSLAVFAWLACWEAGIAFGKPVQGWLGLPAKDEWGLVSSRLPVQLAGALLTLGLIYLVDRFRSRLALPGQQGFAGLAGLGLVLALLSFYRGDLASSLAGLRLDAWAGLAFFAAGLAGFLVTWLRAAARQREVFRPVSVEGSEL
jgi:phosphatidylglycerol:prolipoprotein diacylglycerol transferase